MKNIENFFMWLFYAKPFPKEEPKVIDITPKKSVVSQRYDTFSEFWKDYNFWAPKNQWGFTIGWLIGVFVQSIWHYSEPGFWIGQVVGYFIWMGIVASFYYFKQKLDI